MSREQGTDRDRHPLSATVATLFTVNALFTGRERGIAFAIWGSTIGGMAAVGPVVGGWLTTG